MRAELDQNEVNILRGLLTAIQGKRRMAGAGQRARGTEAMADTSQRVVYMDYAATTPVRSARCGRDGRVPDARRLLRQCRRRPGTASGAAARRRVEEARAQVAQLIGAQAAEITWTSGATESNNLAILGAARFRRDRGTHVITAKTEHKAVLDPCRQLEKEGFRVTYLRPDRLRHRCPGAGRRGTDVRHGAGVAHAREQRDRRDPGHRCDRPPVPRARRAAAHGCGPERGQDSGRCRARCTSICCPLRRTSSTGRRGAARSTYADARRWGSRRSCSVAARRAACDRELSRRTRSSGWAPRVRSQARRLASDALRIEALRARLLAGLERSGVCTSTAIPRSASRTC